jgi:hypothetical protein
VGVANGSGAIAIEALVSISCVMRTEYRLSGIDPFTAPQNSALPGVRGNGITSRILLIPVR